MAELQVVFDPQVEMAAIINVDDRIGWGPTMVGPSARELLQAFIDGLPFDISDVSSYQARTFFESWFQRLEGIAETDTTDNPTGTVGDVPSTGMDADALATAEAVAAGDGPPAAAPFDTDPGATESATDYVSPAVAAYPPNDNDAQVIDCPNCAGVANPSCPLCHGSLKLTVGAAA